MTPKQTYQSFGFDPDTTTLITTWSGDGLGISESIISTRGPLCTIASFIVYELDKQSAILHLKGQFREEHRRIAPS